MKSNNMKFVIRGFPVLRVFVPSFVTNAISKYMLNLQEIKQVIVHIDDNT